MRLKITTAKHAKGAKKKQNLDGFLLAYFAYFAVKNKKYECANY